MREEEDDDEKEGHSLSHWNIRAQCHIDMVVQLRHVKEARKIFSLPHRSTDRLLYEMEVLTPSGWRRLQKMVFLDLASSTGPTPRLAERLTD